ncbi:MAG: hypothetical protein JWQ66_1391 [Mucilaginibacter sp.]|nr:hypothetical protein [Mucilaginibacter sp.]
MIDFDATIKKSFTVDFCHRLEYHLSQAFGNSQNKEIKHVWCDGIEVPNAEDQFIDSFIETKEIVTGAWVGSSRQDKYKMVIRLGSESLGKCLKGLRLNNCLPSNESLDWVDLDIQNRIIILQLK